MPASIVDAAGRFIVGPSKNRERWPPQRRVSDMDDDFPGLV
ncbi:hypothetical protein AB395_00002024 [Sinorhizobium fredii CCBAU 45436]|nr:hypothetical protein AB395_00002024 [Sinorhizobium fredii CCBAU 45436]